MTNLIKAIHAAWIAGGGPLSSVGTLYTTTGPDAATDPGSTSYAVLDPNPGGTNPMYGNAYIDEALIEIAVYAAPPASALAKCETVKTWMDALAFTVNGRAIVGTRQAPPTQKLAPTPDGDDLYVAGWSVTYRFTYQ